MNEDEKTFEGISRRMEDVLKDTAGKKFSWSYFLLTLFITIVCSVGILIISSTYKNKIFMILTPILAISFLWLSFLVSITHYSKSKWLKPANWLFRYLIPIKVRLR